MGEYLDRFNSVSDSYKAFAIFAIALIIGLVNYFLGFSPLKDEYNVLLEKRSSLEKKKVEYDAKSKTLEMDRRINREINRMLNEKKGRLPDTTDIEKVIAVLGRKAEQAAVRIIDIKPKKEEIKELYVEKTIELSVIGSFHETLNFLYMVSKTERIVNMDDIIMSDPVYKNQKAVVKSNLTLKVYRFKKITEEKKEKVKK